MPLKNPLPSGSGVIPAYNRFRVMAPISSDTTRIVVRKYADSDADEKAPVLDLSSQPRERLPDGAGPMRRSDRP